MNSIKFHGLYNRTMTLVMVLTSVTGLFLGTNAHALEDQARAVAVFNWIPSDRTQDENPGFRSVEKHYIHNIHIETLPTGRYQMLVIMPDDLTAGRSPVVKLDETARRPELEEIDFAGPQAKFTCTVQDSWMNAFCKVEFFNLGTTAAQNLDYLNNKYEGTRRIFGQDVLARSFGAEPFGNVVFSDPEFQVTGSDQGNGLWDTTYTDAGGRRQNATVSIDFDKGMYKVNGRNGTLGGIYYEGDLMEGGWTIGESNGWFKFRFQGSNFVGTWGMHDSQNPLGSWNGTRLPQ